MSDDIRVYVADLAAYNNGILHGAWIDATGDISDTWDQVKAMLEASPVEDAEWTGLMELRTFLKRKNWSWLRPYWKNWFAS